MKIPITTDKQPKKKKSKKEKITDDVHETINDTIIKTCSPLPAISMKIASIGLQAECSANQSEKTKFPMKKGNKESKMVGSNGDMGIKANKKGATSSEVARKEENAEAMEIEPEKVNVHKKKKTKKVEPQNDTKEMSKDGIDSGIEEQADAMEIKTEKSEVSKKRKKQEIEKSNGSKDSIKSEKTNIKKEKHLSV